MTYVDTLLLTALGGSIVADLLWFGVGRCWGDGALRVAAVGRARELFLAHRLRALVIGTFLFEINAAVAALAGSEPMSGAPVAEVAMNRAPEVCS